MKSGRRTDLRHVAALNMNASNDMIQIVRKAWSAALAPLDCDFSETWQESGGDSQAIVYLISGLEEALGRRLSYDIFMFDMTADELASKLCAEPDSAPIASEAIVFFLPGVFGDGPYIHDFARSLEKSIHLNVVDLADVTEPIAVLRSIPRMGLIAADEIAKRQPEGPLLIAGISYGGAIAFEAAHQLAASGRQLAFLAILDTALTVVADDKESPGKSSGRMQPIARATGHELRESLRAMCGKSLRLALSPLLASDRFRPIVFGALRRLSVRMHHSLRVRTLRHVRNLSLARWTPIPLMPDADAVRLVAMSEHYAAAIATSWKRLCRVPDVTILPGDHQRFLQNPDLIPAFERGVAEALR